MSPFATFARQRRPLDAAPVLAGAFSLPGRALPTALRHDMERRFRFSFADVRVHTDPAAERASANAGARALTSGNHIAFGPGSFAPTTTDGRRLLAHELGHVVQCATGQTPRGWVDSDPDDPLERDAARRADAALQGRPVDAALQGHSAGLAGSERRPARSPGASGPTGSVQRDTTVPRDPRDAGSLDPSGAPEPQPTAPAQLNFFHGTTWRIAQQIPGNVQAIGGGDFGHGFYTHYDGNPVVAERRARDWAIRLSRNSNPPERYAGVIRFDVALSDIRRLGQKTFGLASTRQPDYAQRQREWLNFVSGPGRGREADPTFDPATSVWRHERVDPPPAQDYELIVGPFYRGVPGTAGAEPPRSAFRPYAEGTTIPQQVVWNYQRSMDILNAAPTTLTQYDTNDPNPQPIVPPHAVAPLNASVMEDPAALEAAQRGLTGR
jgi:hypothetical protein